MTPEPLPSQATDDPAKSPEYPPLETGRVAVMLRLLVARALQRKEIEEQDGVEALRWIDSADAA